MNIYPAIPKAEEHLHPNRDENLDKIDIFLEFLRDTYFKKHNIEAKSTTTRDTYNEKYTTFNYFNISFMVPLNYNPELIHDISNCPIMKLNVECDPSANQLDFLSVYVYSDIKEFDNAVDKFPEFINNYNKSVDSINKFNL